MPKKSLLNKSDEHLDRWMVSYADYMTLLFAVFVVLYAMAIVNEERFQYTMQGLLHAFSNFGETTDAKKGGQQLSEGNTKDILFQGEILVGGSDIVENPSEIKEEDKQGEAHTQAVSELSLLGHEKLGAALAGVEDKLNEVMSPLIENGDIHVDATDDWITLELKSNLVFPSGSATLINSSREVIQDLMPILGPISNFVRIRGYTDSEVVESELFKTNWQLAGERAYSVLAELERLGVNPYRLAYESYGSFSPVASNQTEAGREKNRRVVIAISKYGWDGLTDETRFKTEQTQQEK